MGAILAGSALPTDQLLEVSASVSGREVALLAFLMGGLEETDEGMTFQATALLMGFADD